MKNFTKLLSKRSSFVAGKTYTLVLCIALMLCSISNTAFANIAITRGVAAPCANKAPGQASAGYTVLSGINIAEGANADFTNSATNTITLVTPAGWSFNTAATASFVTSSARITAVSASYPDATHCTISITMNNSANTDNVTINNLEIQQAAVSTPNGDVTASASSNINMAGVTLNSTPFAHLVNMIRPSTSASPTSGCSPLNSALTTTTGGNLGNTAGYTLSSIPYVNMASAGTVQMTTVGSGDMDDGYLAIGLSFPFAFYGVYYTTAYIGTNGYLTLAAGSSSLTVAAIPNASIPTQSINLFLADLNPGGGGTIFYGVTGTAPNRKFVISFNAVKNFNNTTTNTGQIVLNESDYSIDLMVASASPFQGGVNKGTSGIQNTTSSGIGVTGRNGVAYTVSTPEGWRFTPNAYTYSWSPTTFLSASNVANPSINSATSSQTYVLTVTGSGCSAVAAGAGITVNPLPTITTGTMPSVCFGSSSALIPYSATTNGANQYSITWTGAASGLFTNVTNAALAAAPSNITVTVPGGAVAGTTYTGNLTVRNSTTGCVSSTNAITVTISNLPTITTGTMPSVCFGSSSALIPYSATTQSPNQYSITWTGAASGLFANVTNAALAAAPSNITVTVPGGAVAGTTYTGNLTVRNSTTGCVSSTNAITVTILNLPTITTGTMPAVCFGATSAQIPYSATTQSPNQYSIAWTGAAAGLFTDVTNAALAGAPGNITVTVPGGAVAGTTYTGNLTVRNSTTGCVSSINAITVTVNTLPTITTGTMPAVCLGASSALIPYSATTQTPNQYSITWTGAAAGLFTDVTNAALAGAPGNITVTVPGGAIAGTTYTGDLTVRNSTTGCVSSVVAITVTVNGLPTLTGLSSSQTICYDVASLQQAGYAYTGTTFGANEYTLTWTPSGPTNVASFAALPATPLNANVPAATGEGSYTGSLTVRNSSTGCSSNTSLSLAINRLPSVSISATPNPACVGNPIALNGNVIGGFGYSLNWTGPVPSDIVTPTSASASIASATLSDEGDYTLTAVAPACAGSTSDMETLEVNQLPSIGTVSGTPDPACVGGTISLTANVTGGDDYTLLWTHATASINNSTTTNASVTSITTSDAGVYTITASAPGCSTTNGTTSSIVVNTPPTSVTPSALPNPACVGDNIAFTGGVSGGSSLSYSWTTPGGTALDNATVLNAAISSPGVVMGNEGLYTLQVTAAGCAPVSGNFSLEVNQLPSIGTVSGTPDPACVGGTISLTADVTGGDDYTLLWTHATASINNATTTNASVTSITTSDAGIYTITASAPGCSTTNGTTSSIVVNTPPTSVTPSALPNPACVGDNIAFTGGVSGGSSLSYSWTTPGGTALDNAAVENAAISAPGVVMGNEGLYTLNVTAAGCGPVSGNFSLEVNQLPSIGTVSGTPDPACVGGTISLSANVTGGDDYTLLWTHASATITNATSANASVSSITTSDAGVYTITASAPGCSTTNGVTSSIVVNTPPTSVSPSVSSPVCASSNVSFTGGVSGGSSLSYSWSGPGGTAFDDATVLNPTITGVVLGNNGTYNLSVTAAGCAPVVNSTSLTVNQLPASVTANVSPNPNCVGGAVTLTGGFTGSVNNLVYSWAGPITSNITTPNQQNAGVASIIMGDAGSYSLTVTAPACAGSVTGNSTALVVNPTPGAIGGNLPICSDGVTLNLTQSATGGTWTSSNTSVATVDLTTGQVTSVGGGNSTITYTNGGSAGCSVTAVVTVNPRPTPTFTVFPGSSTCVGSTVTYTTQSGRSAYVWTVPGTAGLHYNIISGGLSSADNTVTIQWTSLNDKVVTVGYSDPITLCASTTVASNTTTVNALPATVVVSDANAPSGGPHCGNTTLLANNGGDGIIYFQGQTNNGTSTAIPSISEVVSNASTSAVTRTYYFRARSAAGCWGTQGSLPVTLNPIPTPQTVTMSNGGVYCTGGSGVTVGIANSQVGVNYQLYVDGNPTGSAIAGNNGPRDFGLHTLGTYSVLATYSTSPFCSGPMANSVLVTEAPVPNVYTLTGGGSYCSGGTGINNLQLSNSQVGVTYRLYVGVAQVGSDVAGTGLPIDFATAQGVTGFTTPGNYTVVGNPTSPCATTMAGVATLSVSPAPLVHTFTGTNTICAGDGGVTMYLSGSESGINYQLYRDGITVGGPKPGTGFMLTFTGLTAAGTYSVLAQHGTSLCENAMTGTAILTVLPQPTAYTVSGTASYCAGGAGVGIQLSNTQTNVDYSLYRDGIPTGTMFSGDGNPHTFAGQTAAGVYTVRAVNTLTNCTNTMSGSATVTINALPLIYTATGGGSYCQGSPTSVPMGMGFSSTSANYTLYSPSGLADGPLTGTGGAFSFAGQTTLGSYTVVATSIVGSCTVNMNGHPSVVENPLPTQFNISAGGSYCSGGTGVELTLDGSQGSTNYQLYRNGVSTGSPVSGTGSPISMGLQTTTSNNYIIVATSTSTLCSNTMTGVATVTVTPLPTAYLVSGTGSACQGAGGVAVSIANTQNGVNYELYRNGVATGTIINGNGSGQSFGNQLVSGSYTAVATNTLTLCTNTMSGSATVTINPLPNDYTVTGGGTVCFGGSGVNIGLAGSQSGVEYTLYIDGVPTGSPVGGTGFALSFGTHNTNGLYTIGARNTTTNCTFTMSTSVNVTANALPVAQSMTGGGSYCPGGPGLPIGLANSETGVTYALYLDGNPTGLTQTGSTGSTVSFGLQTATGIYTVGATSGAGCTNTMTGSRTISLFALPTVFTVTGGGGYCPSGSGVTIGLSGSETGVTYQLVLDGSDVSGAVLSGTGSALSYGLQMSTGAYTVRATNGNGCTRMMNNTAPVSVYDLPIAYTLSGSGNYCAGGTGIAMMLSGSQLGVNYQLFLGGSPVGAIVNGSGFALALGNQTAQGNYTMSAINVATGCVNAMSGIATVTVDPLPVAYAVSGGGSYCQGSAGVDVILTNTEANVNYTLLRDGIATGAVYNSTGTGAHTFTAQTLAGNYTVSAQNAITGCTNTMSGSATVSINSLPVQYAVTGGGNYCAGGTGVVIGVNSSNTGLTYQLRNEGGNVGLPQAGTGSPISFGLQMTAGTYSVMATNTITGCTNDMANAVSVGINVLPTAYIVGVTDGGLYCQGGTGVHVTLSGSQSGVNYQLYSGSTPTGTAIGGTGGTLDFGLQTAGTYSVSATNATTTCTNGMTGGATIATTPLPTSYNVTGTGGYCAGGAGIILGLDGSQNGFIYQLYRGATLAATAIGTGTEISFNIQTTAGTYTVLAINNSTNCQRVMNGNGTITINSLPLVHAMNGGGAYCATGTGVHVGMSTTTTGISYQLYNTAGAAGAAVIGTGGSIGFGLQTTAGGYTVIATNTTTGCTSMMSGHSTVIINALPLLYNMTGGGGYCQGGTGMPVGLSGSELGLTYQLFIDGVASGTPAAGSGAALNFGIRTIAGTYTIVANNGATGCSRDMGGSAVITVNPLPPLHTMTGGGSYCNGGAGVAVGLNNSTTGINYQLYNGSVTEGGVVAGTGSSIEFGPIAAAGTYTLLATDAITGCVRRMNGSATVSINPLPTVYAVNGGGAYCQGGTGVHVGMANTESGMSYQLYHNGSPSGTAVTGGGASIDFGLRTAAGTYTVKATNPSTSCVNDMSGGVVITINSLPVVRTVTGGGAYCQGGTGITIGLDNTSTNTSYQLYNGSTAAASAPGTGSPISFGLQTAAGTYTVKATDLGTGCEMGMNGSAVVTINPLPTVYNVTGGGAYCQGGSGVTVGISGSQVGISYQLYNGSGAVGTLTPGTGGDLSFGLQTAAGVYSVTATNMPTSCASNMNGNATVAINLPPTAYSVTGGGANCAGAGGVAVSLGNSENGVSYQLYRGSAAVGAPVAGTGVGISFGNQTTAGTYSVSAINTSTLCYRNMNGGVTVTINPLPLVQSVTGGGSLCQGSAGVTIGLSNSESGVQYELYRGGVMVTTAGGTGGAISFAVQNTAGTYSVLARNTSTTCTQNMLGSALVTVNVLPTAYSVTGGVTSYCAGGTGVAIGLANSESGVSYQLYRNGAATGTPVAGTGSGAITFGNQLSAGTYTVAAINTTTGCRAPMTGSSTISIDPLPNVYPVVGGGSYCQGQAGINVSLSGNQAGITYILLQNGNPILTMPGGAPVDFGPQTAGTYAIRGVSGASCSSMMSGTAVIVENALPTVYDVTGGGSYCQGGAGLHVGLSGSQTGVTYQLLANGNPSGLPTAGTGFGLDFGLRIAAATYTVRATNTTTGCAVTMNLAPTITIKTLPAVFAVTGGGSYCQGAAGVNVGVSGSEMDVTYDLYNGATLITSLPGTTTALDFSARPAGNYTVKATNLGSCESMMTGAAMVTENVLPIAYAMNGGGSYCQGAGGIAVGLANSQTGVSYQLYNGGGATGAAVAGTNGAITFGNQTTAGTYTVVATNTTTGCMQQMSTTVSVFINTPPTVFDVTGGGSYCQGSTGLVIGLSNTETGVSYQLYNGSGAVGLPQAGINNPISFGAQAAGSYNVVATNTTTGCVSNMNGTSVVSMNILPTVFNIGSSASSYCAGSGGVSIALSGSQTGVSYQLQVGGSPTGAPLAGTGSNLTFGMHMAPGLYTVVATNNTSGCAVNMATPVTIGINPLPVPLPVSGGGSYCQGGMGVHIGMGASEPGLRYELYLGSTLKATAIGNGGMLDFGLQTATGTYQVLAVNTSTTCTRLMTGTAVVSTNTLPSVFNMDGGGSYCQGGAGMEVKLTGSQTGISYQLYNGGIATGTPLAGTNNPISFGFRTAGGAYTVVATNNTTGCTVNMSGVANVNVNATPLVYTVTGGGGYCSGGTGVNVGLGNSQAGISYQLLNNNIPTGMPIIGAGGSLGFGLQTAAGVYKVVATASGTGCAADMSGTAVVNVNSLPNVYNVTGGGSYCSGNPAPHVGLSNSQAGMKYQLYRGSTAVGAAVTSTGGSMDFGAQTVPGVYSVYATNATTTCNANMNGSVTVTMNTTVIPSVTILVSPNDTVCAGTNVMYTALATNGGTTPSFEWKVNGFSVAIVSNYNYIPTDGDVVTVTMNSSAVCATPATVTAQVTMTVKPNVTPQVTVTKNTGDTICKGSVVTYTANPLHGGTAPGYQWLLNGSNMPSTASSWMYAPSANDIVSVVMTSNEMCVSTNTAFSNLVEVEVEEAETPVVTITADPGNHIAKGTSVTLTATVTGGGNQPSYQWYINGVVVPGATHPAFTSSGFNHLDSVACEVTNNSACGMRTSSNSAIMYIEGGVSVTHVSNSASDVRLVPNPNKGMFTVKGTLGNNATEEVNYEVTNMLGQVVYKAKAMVRNGEVDQQIQLPNVANGMYMLTLKTATENKVFHVVVEQ